MTPEQVQEILDNFIVRPRGMFEMTMHYDEGKIIAAQQGYDSHDERFFEEYPPEWPDVEPHTQEFSQAFEIEDAKVEDVILAASRVLAYAGAHELIEWTRYLGETPIDLHEPGNDVSVQL